MSTSFEGQKKLWGSIVLKSVQFHAPFNTLTRLAVGFGLKGFARPIKDSPQNIGSPASNEFSDYSFVRLDTLYHIIRIFTKLFAKEYLYNLFHFMTKYVFT